MGRRLRLPLENESGLGVKGEFYTRQGLGFYNGAILQIVNGHYHSIRSTGGWFELFAYWTPSLHSHFGFGIDDPMDNDVPSRFHPRFSFAGRTQNNTAYGNLIWDVSKAFRVSFEVAWRKTLFRSQRNNDGMFFHTQFAWNF